MSHTSSAVTYTSVYTDSEPGRVFWGADEELSDGGPLRVIVYGYDGLPMLPVAPPSPDYITGPEEPQIPPAPQDEDEHEPIFIQPHDPDFAPKPIYPEYIPLEDEHILSVEEQPLPPSDPEKNPEEYEDDETKDGLVDYPMDGGDDGDDDDGDSSGYNADGEEEEEEHLTSADSTVVIPTDDLTSISLPPKAEVERLLAMPTPSPSPFTSLSPPSAWERLARCTTPAALPSPLLPPSLYPPPPVDRRDDIPESEQPPRKRLCLSTLGSREVRYGIRDTWIDSAEIVPEMAPTTLEEVNTRVTELAELHKHNTQDLYALLEDAQDGRTRISQGVAMDSQRVDLLMGDRMTLLETEYQLQTHQTQLQLQSTLIQTQHQLHETHSQIQQIEIVRLRETDHVRQSQIVETFRVMRDMRQEMGDMQAELLALRGQPRRAGQPGGDARDPPPPNTNTLPHHMTSESVQAIIDQALLRNSTNGDGSQSLHGDNPRNVQTTRPCFYADFMKCHPLNFKENEGVFGLTRWIEKMESVFNISGCAIENQVKFATCTMLDVALTWWNGQIMTLGPEAYAMTWEVLKKKMTDKYCSRGEVKKLEIELWNLKNDEMRSLEHLDVRLRGLEERKERKECLQETSADLQKCPLEDLCLSCCLRTVVDDFACPASFLWHTAKHVIRDPALVAADFNEKDYATLVAHPSLFWKFLKAFLCLVGLRRHYTLDEETYPWFFHKNGEGGNGYLSFHHTPDPTKVKIVKREQNKGEPLLLETTISRNVPLLPVTPDHAESELDASVEKLFDEGGSGNQKEQGDSTSSRKDADIQPVIKAVDTVVEDVAPMQLKRQGKRKYVVVDTGDTSHPPKKLRDDLGTPSGTSIGGKSMSILKGLLARAILNAEVRVAAIPTLPFMIASISTTPEREGGDHTDSVAGLNLRVIEAPSRFVISSDSSHHSGTNVTEAEVNSLVRSFVSIMKTVTTITSTVDLASVAKEKLVETSPFCAGSSSAGGTDPTTGGFLNL
nr:hypothetical protein [Tanacetum cinerariifolium]